MSDTKSADAGIWSGAIAGKPAPGAIAHRSRHVGLADIEAFTSITGDRNPLHYDRELAEKTVFGKLIVQGGVTSGILNAVVAEDLPGPGTVFLECRWKFLKAVGADETITGEIEILSPTADKYFSRIGKLAILSDLADARQAPAAPSWEKMKKGDLAALAEREVAGTGWLPEGSLLDKLKHDAYRL